MKIELNEKEQSLRVEIEERVQRLRKAFADSRAREDESILVGEAGKRAHELHMQLKGRGCEPKHHAYMIKNRGLQPDDPEFYIHFHPIEDLLKFLDNPQANEDPVDQTIGSEFTFSVFSRRWGHDDTYNVKRTADGWEVKHIAIGGPCDKGGHPFLFSNFNQDFIQYPSGLDGWIEWLWSRAAEHGLSNNDVQTGLQQLADWVSYTEKSAPSGGVWKGY